MFKRIICVFIAICILTSTAMLLSCGKKEAAPPEGLVTRVTVDINPSIEMMIDDNNKIISVTALNDDGSILIAGEALVGKTPWEGVDLIIDLADQTGFLIKGNLSLNMRNEVKLSVSGESKYADQLREKLADTATETMDRLDIEGKVREAEALTPDELKKLAVETLIVSEEEAANMSEEELYKVVSAGRIETSLLLTEELRKVYYAAKEHRISFVEREETAKIIEEMGGVYKLVHAAYNTALQAYSKAIADIDNFRFEHLVSLESEYQKALQALREAKTDLLTQKNYVATLQTGTDEYTTATISLQMSEETYNIALAAFEKLGEVANEAIDLLISVMKEAEKALIALEEKFPDSINAELEASAQKIEDAINAKKDACFAEFEAEYKEDILFIESKLIEQKQALIAAVTFSAEETE